MDQFSTFNQVKQFNVRQIKNALRILPQATKQKLAQLTGLSVTTCGTIVNELLESGELLPVDADPSMVGRPPKAFAFNRDYAYICCVFPTIEADGRYLYYAVNNLLGESVCTGSQICVRLGIEEILAQVECLLAAYPQIRYLAAGIPGYDLDGVICSCPIAELDGQNLAQQLRERFALPVYMENDMNAIAYGFYTNCADEVGEGDGFVAIAAFQNLRLGAGVVLNGKIIHGHTHFAGEIFYLRHTRENVHTIVFENLHASTIEMVSEGLKSFCVAMDPAIVVLTGEEINEQMLRTIQERCMEHIPPEHMPNLRYEPDYVSAVCRGLTQIIFDELF